MYQVHYCNGIISFHTTLDNAKLLARKEQIDYQIVDTGINEIIWDINDDILEHLEST
jgi:hypothetical protein